MSRTWKKAEEAAYNGEGQEFDTQLCTHLQNEFLSSSPGIPVVNNASDANANAEPALVEKADQIDDDEPHVASPVTIQLECTLLADVEGLSPEIVDQARSSGIGCADDDSSPSGKSLQLRRDPLGNLRRTDATGKDFRRQVVGFHEKHCKGSKEMEDFSPSSLSPTQANSESVYHPYYQVVTVNRLESTCDGDANEADEDGQTQKGLELTKQHHSAVTDSTAHTYGENDTGHVKLFLTALGNQDSGRNVSQDASLVPQVRQPCDSSFEPRTPAPVNPFSQKGSVMKGHEMFGATQPSSICRHAASPTSSRPSPDIYSNFSPQVRLVSSPLGRHGDENSILQSSVRTILRSKSTESHQHFEPPPTTFSRSFGNARSRHEPRDTYVSIKESQERRQKGSSTSDEESESESETEIEARMILERQRREREAKVQKQLAQVTSSRPGSGTSGHVEVPASGGRRRSVEEDYVAQCNGTDARDTQQEDVVIDSQIVVEDPEGSTAEEDTTSPPPVLQAQAEDTGSPNSSPQLPSRRLSIEPQQVPDLYAKPLLEDASSPPKDASHPPQPTFPLQEVSTNRNDLKTPIASKAGQVLSDGADTPIPNTILETSPLGEDRIRPMGEVTSLSFADNVYDDSVIEGAPGFTQDVEYNNAINTHFSPTPPPKSRVTGFPVFKAPANFDSELLAPEISAREGDACKADILNGPQKIITVDGGHESKEPKPQVAAIEDIDRAVVAPQAVEKDGPVDGIILLHNEDNSSEQHKHPRASRAAPKPSKEPIAKRSGLRTKEELKGPSKALRRADEITTPKSNCTSSLSAKPISVTKTNSARSSKHGSDVSSNSSTPLSSLGSTPTPEPTPASVPRKRKAATQNTSSKAEIPIPLPRQRSTRQSNIQAQGTGKSTLAAVSPIRSSKRKTLVFDDDEPPVNRALKRQSISHLSRESSDDPLAHPSTTRDGLSRKKKSTGLFADMSFAVSYSKHEQEKYHVSTLINDYGGRLLEDGFEKLFESASLSRSRSADEDAELTLMPAAQAIGFVALIADEHSRKAKYMQALALGLPCISGKWILTCIGKGEIIDWTPYLLCAGQSAFLGNAICSRTLARYSAVEAKFPETISSRVKLLKNKSVLLVTAKGREETRKAYIFLTRALGPARIDQVSDHAQARKKLLEDGAWDLLYVDKNDSAAEAAVFGSSATISSGTKRKKRGPNIPDGDASLSPKRIRIITDEVIIQSLILGQLLDD